METMYYIGLDVHKKTISYCVKDGNGRIYSEGSIPATRLTLDMWMKTLPQPWTAAMEATIFTAWIYDHLKPHAAAVKVAHPLMLRAIAAAASNGRWRSVAKSSFVDSCYMCCFVASCGSASSDSLRIGIEPHCCHCANSCWRPARVKISPHPPPARPGCPLPGCVHTAGARWS